MINMPSVNESTLQQPQNGLVKHGAVKKRSDVRRAVPQVIATIGFSMLILGVSAICAMPTIILGSLFKGTNSTEIPITAEEASWFGSVVYVAQPVGSVVSGFIQEIFGRKRCMLAVNVPQIVGWVILSFSQSANHLLSAAVLMSLSIGFMEAPAMSYLGEVCEPKLRGHLLLLPGVFLFFGMLVEFLIGATLHWRYACATSALIPITTFVIILFIPESPVWYIVKGRTSEAEKALMWLRGWVTKDEVQQELNQLINDIKLQDRRRYVSVPTSESSTVEQKQNLSAWDQVKLLLEPKVYNPILLVTVFFFVGHCVTLLGMRPFLVQVFQDLQLKLSPFVVLILVGVFQLAGSLSSILLIHRLGKRKLAFSSLVISSIGVIVLAVYLLLSINQPWIPMAMFGLVFFGGGLGVMSLPWVLISEIFPLDARGLSAGIAAASCYLTAFIVTKTYLDLLPYLELSGVLIAYFLIGMLGLIFLYFKLPETEGRTLTQIEEFFILKAKPQVDRSCTPI